MCLLLNVPAEASARYVLLSHCFRDHTYVMWPAQILSDVDRQESEAADPLHLSSLHVDGGAPSSLQSPVVHDELLVLADVYTMI